MYWLRRRNSRYSRCSGTPRAEWALAETDDEQARPKGGPRPSRAPRLDIAFLHSPGEGSVRRHPAAAHAGRRGCFTNQRHWCKATTAWRAARSGRVRRAPEGLRGIRAIDFSRRGSVLLVLDHKQFPVRHLCETASVQTNSVVECRRRGWSCRWSGSRRAPAARSGCRLLVSTNSGHGLVAGSGGRLCPTAAAGPGCPTGRLVTAARAKRQQRRGRRPPCTHAGSGSARRSSPRVDIQKPSSPRFGGVSGGESHGPQPNPIATPNGKPT